MRDHALRLCVWVLGAALFVSFGASAASALTFTCETIVRDKASLDPAGAEFRGRFDAPRINGSGDVVFFTRARSAPRRLYYYPAVGAPSILAEEGGLAPGGSAWKRFENPSINDAGAIGLRAQLFSGEGVFLLDTLGGGVRVAATGDPAPGGGTFARFVAVSRVNAAGDIAFGAEVEGGADGIFVYDAGTMTLSAAVRVGDPTGDGREFCEFLYLCKCGSVALSDLGNVAFQAATKLTCLDPGGGTAGIWQQSGLLFTNVADVGDPTPIAGTTYDRFLGAPDVNAAEKVLFRARTGGATRRTAVFLFDPVGPATTTVVTTGDVAPGGGVVKKLSPAQLTTGDRAALGARIAKGTARTGLFLFDGTDEAVVRDTDAVPTDQFPAGSTYRKINPGLRKTNEELDFDRSGTRAVYSAKVRPSSGRSRTGLFRCAGS